MMKSPIEEAAAMMAADRPLDALDILDAYLSVHSADHEALLLRGKTRWRLGRRSGAMADYAQAAENAPGGDVRAAEALEQCRDIMDFFNHDLLNP